MTALSVSTIVEALGIVGLNCNSLDLRAGAAANVKGRSNLALLTRSNLLVLRLRCGTTARGVDGLKMDRRISDIFIFEMRDRLLVVKAGRRSTDVCSHFSSARALWTSAA